MTLGQLFFSFRGRLDRQAYWLLYVLPVELPVSCLIIYLDLKSPTVIDDTAWIVPVLFFWPALAVQTKRWHDRNKSAWWLLVNLIPFGFFWALVENGFLRGTDGPNKYGVRTISAF